jgi:hypothetical protein
VVLAVQPPSPDPNQDASVCPGSSPPAAAADAWPDAAAAAADAWPDAAAAAAAAAAATSSSKQAPPSALGNGSHSVPPRQR